MWGSGPLWEMTAVAMGAVITVWVVLRLLLGLYPGYGLDAAEQLRRHTYATLATLAILAVFALGFQAGELLSRLILAVVFSGLLILAPFVHYFAKLSMRKMNLWGKPVVVLGYKESGANVVSLFKKEWALGYEPVAIFDYRLEAVGAELSGVDDWQGLAVVVDLAREHGVDTAILAMPNVRREQLARLSDQASLNFRQVIVIPNLGGITNAGVVARYFAGTFGVEIRHNLLYPWARRTKRVLDLLLTAVGGVLISPLLIMVATLIKLDSSGPAFYRQLRPGAGGEHFHCWKFRTMHINTELLLDEYLQANPHLRSEWERTFKLRNDPRVTRVGRFLRKTSLDELPQLWNVLCGEMSLVGPRPMLVEEISAYGEVYRLYKRVRPGITGLWQVSGRNDTSHEERIEMVASYVSNWSVWLDLVILARTIKTVLLGHGAH